MHILVLNCGSATVKYKLFATNGDPLDEVCLGMVEVEQDHATAIDRIIKELPARPDAVAHRVVHGGERYSAPVRIDDEVLAQLKAMAALAPLHNPPALAGIEAAASLGVAQVAVFDTAFHQTMPEHAYRYALPREVVQEHGIRRYGFHGISHQVVTERYAQITGSQNPTIITLHLGNGASAAAIKDGHCVDTTMGVTPLEGLMMGTRAGDLDPGIVLRLWRRGMSRQDVERLLWHESGLLGVAGDKDMRALLARSDDDARLAVELFCYRVRKTIGAYLAALGGAEAVVFTGGIGERAAPVRARILEPLAFLGIRLDPEANRRHGPAITLAKSAVQAYVVPTNEELRIAQEAMRILPPDA